jgi:outer membrane cobalamin receptor
MKIGNKVFAVSLLSALLINTAVADDEYIQQSSDWNTPSDYIETIVVIGSEITETETDVSQDFSIIETIMPAVSYLPGGYGGFAGFMERGTQTIHTTVFKNGVPANDAGNGWYDFAHDLTTGSENVKVVNGANSVMFGSGSVGGTVFLTDRIETGATVRVGEQHTLTSVSVFDALNISTFKVNNGSVRNDNTEDDEYENQTIKFVKTFGNNITVAANHVDYEYDYDNCYTPAFSTSNDCMQDGTKKDISVRNDNFTVGYSSNESEYFTEGALTYASKAERMYADVKDNVQLSNAVNVIAGATYSKEKYAGDENAESSVYTSVTFKERLQLGLRASEDTIVYRGGYTTEDFYVSVGTTYRNPTLYQLKGDSWVQANPNLKPEEGLGFEVGYKAFSYFNYAFDENIDYDYVNSQYVNTGSYDTSGVRYKDMFAVPYGSFNVMVGFTDSDQPRVAEWKSRLSYFASFNKFTTELVYTTQLERGIDPISGTELNDLESVDFVIGLDEWSNGLKLDLTVQNLFDKEVEVIPGYDAGGRNIFLTLTYK